jgi:SEC-C motif-containing protein
MIMRLSEKCPCNSGKEYRQCCKLIIKGCLTPENAEALLAARFSAKIKGENDFLIETWHNSTQPEKLEAELPYEMKGFKIIPPKKKIETDPIAYITYSVYIRMNRVVKKRTIKSMFKYESGKWLFLNQKILDEELLKDISKPLPQEIANLHKIFNEGKDEPSKINREDFEEKIKNSISYLENKYEELFGRLRRKSDVDIGEIVFNTKIDEKQEKAYFTMSFQGIMNAIDRRYSHISDNWELYEKNPNSLKAMFRFFGDIVFELKEFLNLLEDRYNDDFSYYSDFGKRGIANSKEIFHCLSDHLYHYYGQKSFGDFVRQPIAAFLIRQAIELRVKNGLGIHDIFIGSNHQRITADKFIDFINNNVKIKFPIKISILKKIHAWTNHYIHRGILLQVWKMDLAYELLKPLFQGNRYNVYGSVEINSDYYNKELENEIKKFLFGEITIVKRRNPEAQLVKDVKQKNHLKGTADNSK